MNGDDALTHTIRTGRVALYDEEAGLGEVEASDDSTRYPFHATGIADGTRRIAAGTTVHFVVVFAARGRLEATGVSAC